MRWTCWNCTAQRADAASAAVVVSPAWAAPGRTSTPAAASPTSAVRVQLHGVLLVGWMARRASDPAYGIEKVQCPRNRSEPVTPS